MIKIKKKSLVLITLLIQSIFIISFISANPLSISNVGYSVDSTINLVVEAFTPLFQALFGDYGSSEFLFAKVLLFFMLMIIINAVLKKVDFFQGNKTVVTILSIAVPLLSIRYLQDTQLINGILLPYSTLGITITTILPILIFFYFVHFSNMGGFGRRISWIFFIIVFLILWSTRYDQLGELGNKIYGWTAVFIALAFIFDKNVHGYFKTWEINTFYRKANQRTIAALQAEYLNIVNVNTNDAKARRTDIENQLRTLGANLP